MNRDTKDTIINVNTHIRLLNDGSDIYSNGVRLTPMKLENGNMAWVAVSIEDECFTDGSPVNMVSGVLDELVKFDIDEIEDEVVGLTVNVDIESDKDNWFEARVESVFVNDDNVLYLNVTDDGGNGYEVLWTNTEWYQKAEKL